MADVRVDAVTVGYRRGSVALHEVTCHFSTGITCLLGPNGSGKTTLLRAIATLLGPTEGTITLGGSVARGRGNLKLMRRAIGYSPQESCYPSRLAVGEALSYSAWLARLSSGTAQRAIGTALERWDLGSYRTQQLRTLSTGTRRRVDIAGAMLHDPAVVLLDEPTAGVDLEHRAGLRTALKNLAQDHTVVMSSHVAEDVEILAHHVAALKGGHLVFTGTASDLVRHAASIEGEPNESGIERAVRWALTYA